MTFELPQLVPPTGMYDRPDPIAEAVAQADAIRQQAYEEGLAAGMAEGRAACAPAAEALVGAAAGLDELRIHVTDGLERGAVGLALRIAEQIIGAAVTVEPERVLEAIRGALRRLADRERVQILVNPEDLDIVRGGLDDLISQLGGISSVDVQAERRVSRGGAIVRTGEGDVDASIETKLTRAREVLEREFADG
ncbi:MAG: hypothetical protein JHC84_09360 [Solirubrobacteraceae bacterium]|nr:hypothetical protein [Solirubrobacteraceae bacterium]